MQRTHFVLISQFGVKLICTGRNWSLSREASWTQSKVHQRFRGEGTRDGEGWKKIKARWNNAVKIKEAFRDHEENDKERKRKKKKFFLPFCVVPLNQWVWLPVKRRHRHIGTKEAVRAGIPWPLWDPHSSIYSFIWSTQTHAYAFPLFTMMEACSSYCLEHFPLGIPC